MKRHLLSALATLVAAIAPAHAHDQHKPAAAGPATGRVYAWGQPGDSRKAADTIAVDMADTMRFTPDRLVVRQGATVKFVVRNRGKLMHEMVLGTEGELRRHAEMMRKHPGMEHEEPYMAHVAPGKTETLAWTFSRPGTFMYGCLIPGHWESGMKGTIVVTPR